MLKILISIILKPFILGGEYSGNSRKEGGGIFQGQDIFLEKSWCTYFKQFTFTLLVHLIYWYCACWSIS